MDAVRIDSASKLPESIDTWVKWIESNDTFPGIIFFSNFMSIRGWNMQTYSKE